MAGPGEKDVVATLVGLQVGPSRRPVLGTRTAVQGHCPGCTLETLGSSGCETHLAPSQGGNATLLNVSVTPGQVSDGSCFLPWSAAHLVSAVDLRLSVVLSLYVSELAAAWFVLQGNAIYWQ